jgi:hypothetical protein
MDDIFNIQEDVAQKVLDGLKLHLTQEEKSKLAKKPTENAEAYELFLKGGEHVTRQTKSDFERALSLYEEAFRLDQAFTLAHANIANICTAIYRSYDRNPALLDRASEGT